MGVSSRIFYVFECFDDVIKGLILLSMQWIAISPQNSKSFVIKKENMP